MRYVGMERWSGIRATLNPPSRLSLTLSIAGTLRHHWSTTGIQDLCLEMIEDMQGSMLDDLCQQDLSVQDRVLQRRHIQGQVTLVDQVKILRIATAMTRKYGLPSQ